MNIINMVSVEIKGAHIFADVEVRVGPFWNRRTERMGVYKEQFAIYWRWADSGRFTPFNHVENLYSLYRARQDAT